MNQPTGVLVHGALTDASLWCRVSVRLQDAGYPVIAPSLPCVTSTGTSPTSSSS
jgi:pimeloyl-ACP methyl ester carboxylesterase